MATWRKLRPPIRVLDVDLENRPLNYVGDPLRPSRRVPTSTARRYGSALASIKSSAKVRASGEGSLDSRERLPMRPPLRVSSLPSRVLVPRHVCRNSLTLRNHGETVVLEDDPLDVPDEVLRHDSELPRIHPDVPVLIHSDRDYVTAILEGALARDLDAPAGRVNLVCPFDFLVDLS